MQNYKIVNLRKKASDSIEKIESIEATTVKKSISI